MRKAIALALSTLIIPLFSCSVPFEQKEVSIETMPPEAQIYVGGEFFGLTPKTIKVPYGVKITIVLDGYEDEVRYASWIEDSKFLRVNLRKYHEIMLNYVPDGSEVFEDGKLLGITPLTVKRTAGRMKLIVKHEYHFDFEDSFQVNSIVIRAKSLKPKVRYFPDTECMITSDPPGVNVIHLGIKNGEIVTQPKLLGTTPLNISNSELFKISPERLLILENQESLPSVIYCTGSFSVHIKMEKSNKKYFETPKDFASSISFAKGEVTSEKLTLSAMPENSKFKISNPNFGVSIVDLETNLTKDSGAGFYKNRFFVVRTNDAMSEIKYIAYDTLSKKRVRFENMSFYRELDVAGDIAYRQRVPVVRGKIEIFTDFAYAQGNDFGVFFIKFLGIKSPMFVIKSDLKMENPQIIRIIMY